jgi:hypothetical protein
MSLTSMMQSTLLSRVHIGWDSRGRPNDLPTPDLAGAAQAGKGYWSGVVYPMRDLARKSKAVGRFFKLGAAKRSGISFECVD